MYNKAGAEAYFMAEKQTALFILIVGAAALISAVLLYWLGGKPFWKGFALPLGLIALVQLAVGYTVYTRSDSQRKDVVYKMDMNPQAIANEELPRMEKVMKQFVVYRYAEIVLLAAGVILFFYFRQKPTGAFWSGVGLALALQAVLMLAVDFTAEQRGEKYMQVLNEGGRSGA